MNRNQVVSVLLLLLVNENCLQESRGDSVPGVSPREKRKKAPTRLPLIRGALDLRDKFGMALRGFSLRLVQGWNTWEERFHPAIRARSLPWYPRRRGRLAVPRVLGIFFSRS